MFDIVGVGTLDVSIYLNVDRIPQYDEKVLAKSHQYLVGGMIANSLVVASRLGLKTVLHAPVGQDQYGEMAIEGMKKNNVDISGLVHKPEGGTYFCVVMLDDVGEKSLIVVPSDNMDLKALEFDAKIITSAKHMHTILFDDVELAVDTAKENGMTISMDIETTMLNGNFDERLKKLLPKIDILFLGESAANILGHGISPDIDVKNIFALGVKVVCLTQGDKGGLIHDEGGISHFPAYKIKPVDSTGAGDSFAGGFIYGFLNNWDNIESAKFASAVAAINTLSYGGHDGAPTLAETQEFIQSTNLN